MAQLLSTEARHLSQDGYCVVCGQDAHGWGARLPLRVCGYVCFAKLKLLERNYTRSVHGHIRPKSVILEDLKNLREGLVAFEALAGELGHTL
jgi:hypothetical protein